jgi:hypothetical protein
MSFRISLFVVCLLILLVATAALAQNQPAGSSSLKYKLIEKFGSPFFCDRDEWPVARPQEPRAKEWFSQADLADQEFKAISSHLKLEKPADHLQADEILSLYQEHKKLQAITVEGSGNNFKFAIRTGEVGGQGESISGTITSSGEIKVLHKETVWNDCPRCLAEGTRIATPQGEVAVQDLQPGMPVWTLGKDGARVAGVVESVVRIPVPLNHEVVRMKLENGRTLFVSPEHPLADGGIIGQRQAGDALSGSRILSAERIRYTADFTYDLLPSGPTGFYWAEGVLLATTISR